MTTEEIKDLARDGVDILRARSKLVSQAHRERIKELVKLEESLRRQRKMGDLGIEVETTISPELKRLLADPTHNL